jgi:hypothetical protein
MAASRFKDYNVQAGVRAAYDTACLRHSGKPTERSEVGDPDFTSWNQTSAWLRRLEALRLTA